MKILVLAGAGLDVLETPPPTSALLAARNCIVTPHVAWATREARSRLMEQAIGNLRAFISGQARNVLT